MTVSRDVGREGRPARLASLLARVGRAGILDAEELRLPKAAGKLRNSLAHPDQQTALTPGAAAPMLSTAHELIDRLFAGEACSA